ncbi:MAG: peptidoglycan editing factor PgeF [Sulfurospirillaceae bacterium]|nr:peptidoglycan editing factor PgeF [Sulfurospirillaceae bacterium]
MKHLFTNRFGGVSHPPYDSFNLALHVGDNSLHVEQNRDILKKKIGVSSILFMNQVHGDIVECVDKNTTTPSCDAMITNAKGLALCVMVADCIPVLLFDKVRNVIGVAHAGRAGSFLHIGQKTVQKMLDNYGSCVENISIFMGPSIRSCCYEVSKEIVCGFESYLTCRGGKCFLDLQTLNRDDFLKIGILPKNIMIEPTCNCCDKRFFSYRRDGVTGRFCGIIALE